MRSDPCLVQLARMRSDPGGLERPSVQLAYARSDPCPVQLVYTRSDPCPFQLAHYLWSFPVFGLNALLLPVLLPQNWNSRSGATATSGAILVIAVALLGFLEVVSLVFC